MGNTGVNWGQKETLKATVDLSSYQHKAVIAGSADDLCGPAGAAANAIGVLENKPAAAGRAASVTVFGVTKGRSGGTIVAGADIAVDATATFVTAASGDYILGSAKTGVASGYLFSLRVTHAGYKGA